MSFSFVLPVPLSLPFLLEHDWPQDPLRPERCEQSIRISGTSLTEITASGGTSTGSGIERTLRSSRRNTMTFPERNCPSDPRQENLSDVERASSQLSFKSFFTTSFFTTPFSTFSFHSCRMLKSSMLTSDFSMFLSHAQSRTAITNPSPVSKQRIKPRNKMVETRNSDFFCKCKLT